MDCNHMQRGKRSKGKGQALRDVSISIPPSSAIRIAQRSATNKKRRRLRRQTRTDLLVDDCAAKLYTEHTEPS